jgi:hypothetical protein
MITPLNQHRQAGYGQGDKEGKGHKTCLCDVLKELL